MTLPCLTGEDIKKALEATIGQLINTKYDLVQNQKTDYVCLDDIIVDLKLTPDVLEMRVPRYFRDDKDAEIRKRDDLMVRHPSTQTLQADPGWELMPSGDGRALRG